MSKAEIILDADARAEILETFLAKVHEQYVFPEVAQKMEEVLRQRLLHGEYDHLTSAELFCLFLTAHLQDISQDKHFFLVFHAKKQSPDEHAPARVDDLEKLYPPGSLDNFGFRRVERLAGNIGYLELRSFYPAEIAGEVAVATMNFLAHTSALIIDLRHNNGGEPSMIALLSSYLFEGEPVHLNSFYRRAQDRLQQFWTWPYVPGKRYSRKPVYVLISSETVSAAEEFAYNLKHMHRATLIGKTTVGAAHPMESFWIHSHIEAYIPAWRAINPITGTNWEGVGVAPDIEGPSEDALRVAHIEALKRVLEGLKPVSREPLKTFAQEIKTTLTELGASPPRGNL